MSHRIVYRNKLESKKLLNALIHIIDDKYKSYIKARGLINAVCKDYIALKFLNSISTPKLGI
jgi:hypothetical protein